MFFNCPSSKTGQVSGIAYHIADHSGSGVRAPVGSLLHILLCRGAGKEVEHICPTYFSAK
jgi:hypothetical protein